MKSKKPPIKRDWESVKISKTIVEMVRENKRKTFMPIGVFFEEAAKEKLKQQKSK